MLTTDKVGDDVLVNVTSKRLSEPKSALAFRFTAEGLIIDHVSKDGDVLATFGRTWDEVEDMLA